MYQPIDARYQQVPLLAALFRGLGEDPYKRYAALYDCVTGKYGCEICEWDNYFTMAFRSQCKDASGDIKIASSSQVYEALRSISSIPPYDPLDESRAAEPSTHLLSFKSSTFITLSNLHSHSGPWASDKVDVISGKPNSQISDEALRKLKRFTVLVANPVSTARLREPVFKQTMGTILNVHVVAAELGIIGRYKGDRLEGIDIDKGLVGAWECSLDTVFQEMRARVDSRWGSREEFSKNLITESITSPLDCPPHEQQQHQQQISLYSPAAQGSLKFLWNNTTYSVDNRIIDSMAKILETLFAGSSFGKGWQSRRDMTAATTYNSTSFVSNILPTESARWLTRGGIDGVVPVAGVFWSMAESLTQYLRHYNKLDRYSSGIDEHRKNDAYGRGYVGGQYCVLQWYYIWYPSMLVSLLLLLTVVAALDEYYHRIRLSEDDTIENSIGQRNQVLGTTTRRRRQTGSS